MTDSSPPAIVRTVADLREATRAARREGKVVGFVPTMGALHRGHLRLVEVACERADFVVVSIYVNPTQFGPNEDLDQYPRDLEGDVAAVGKAGAGLVFAPTTEQMYPAGHATEVAVPRLAAGLCGVHRPVHFGGVATIVTKLFNQVGPCIAAFGRKDYQQLTIVKQLVRDLDLEVEVVGVPTVREEDGLALSSRNAYLKPEERGRARALVQGLSAAWRLVAAGEPVRAAVVRSAARAPMAAQLDSVDYVEICDPDTLEPFEDDQFIVGPTLVVAAGRLGTTRLIDNLVLNEQDDPLA